MKRSSLSRLSPNERQAVQEYMREIKSRYPGRILSVILFGSKARGDDDSESDIDLLVLVDSFNAQFRSELWRIASDVSLKHTVVISALVFGQVQWNETQRLRLPLSRAVATDGITLAG